MNGQIEMVKSAVKKWYRTNAEGRCGACEDCSFYMLRGEAYLRPGGHLCCERCTDELLGMTNWTEALPDMDRYFGPGVPQNIVNMARGR